MMIPHHTATGPKCNCHVSKSRRFLTNSRRLVTRMISLAFVSSRHVLSNASAETSTFLLPGENANSLIYIDTPSGTPLARDMASNGGNMATILKNGMNFSVGKDFVDAVYLTPVSSRGIIEVAIGKRIVAFNWQSTFSQQDAEHVLRSAAGKEHKRIVTFVSQAA